MDRSAETKRFATARFEHRGVHLSNAAGFHKHVETLTESQKGFIHLLLDWFKSGRPAFVLAIVSGGPGSGKTHAVVKTLDYLRDVKVLKMAPTARLANNIGGKTIHSALRLDFKEGSVLNRIEKQLEDSKDTDACLASSACLLEEFRYGGCGGNASPDIVVLDELSMSPFWLVYQMARYFIRLSGCDGGTKRGKSVMMICMGDSYQLKPVASKMNVFHFPFEDYFSTVRIEMRESMRFTPDYERVVNNLRRLMTADVEREKEGGEECSEGEGETSQSGICETDPFFAFIRKVFPVRECITVKMLFDASRVLAYKNETVKDCNDIYVKEILKSEPVFEFPAVKKCNSRSFFEGNDQFEEGSTTCLRKNSCVVVSENGCGENTFNGTRLRFLKYNKADDTATCEDEEKTGRRVKVKRSAFTGKIPLVPSFATTIHKHQGETIDGQNIVICFDGSGIKNLIYTGLSRVRDMKQILAVVL